MLGSTASPKVYPSQTNNDNASRKIFPEATSVLNQSGTDLQELDEAVKKMKERGKKIIIDGKLVV